MMARPRAQSPSSPAFFLPYQRRWMEDDARIKIAEKSRRIGWTYVQSYEDVRDVSLGTVPTVWFSSADETAAKEYILYCAQWARALNLVAQELGTIVIDKERDIKALSIEFANGGRINALSSNPKGFRSKGGKVVLDEFAWHDDAQTMWSAASPAITWGFPMRIFSTHNGVTSLFNRFIQRIKKGELGWSLHTTDIQRAVDDGLLDKIMRRATTAEERQAWIAELHANCADEETWLQEYCCVPSDESTAFISYDMIYACEQECLWPQDATSANGDLYLGMDIGRKRDLSVIWISERSGSMLYTRKVITIDRRPFREQREILYQWLAHPRLRRACIDATGIGSQLAEDAQIDFGRYRVEAVTFTGPVKEDLSYRIKSRMEDRLLAVPPDPVIRESFHSIRKLVTAAGNIRFDAERSDETRHADHYWAAALSVHAVDASAETDIQITTAAPYESLQMTRGYF